MFDHYRSCCPIQTDLDRASLRVIIGSIDQDGGETSGGVFAFDIIGVNDDLSTVATHLDSEGVGGVLIMGYRDLYAVGKAEVEGLGD
jgi:hypothetical protein